MEGRNVETSNENSSVSPFLIANDNPFDVVYEENNTPTLPNFENQGMRVPEQPMPEPIPREKSPSDYNYSGPLKAKSS